MRVINNFIQDKSIFNNIKNLLMSSDFPYYYNNYVVNENDSKSDYFFSHIVYKDNQQTSDFFNKIIVPILDRLKELKLDFNYLHRAKVNCYTKKHKEIQTEMHTDMPEKHTVAIFSINSNNGYTLFENKDKILSIENQLVLFDGSIKHCSVAQTDENLRININLNLL